MRLSEGIPCKTCANPQASGQNTNRANVCENQMVLTYRDLNCSAASLTNERHPDVHQVWFPSPVCVHRAYDCNPHIQESPHPRALKSPKSLKKAFPGLPARSVKKVSEKSPNTDFVVETPVYGGSNRNTEVKKPKNYVGESSRMTAQRGTSQFSGQRSCGHLGSSETMICDT